MCALAVASRQWQSPRGVVSSGGLGTDADSVDAPMFVVDAAAACSALRAARFESPVLIRKFKILVKSMTN